MNSSFQVAIAAFACCTPKAINPPKAPLTAANPNQYAILNPISCFVYHNEKYNGTDGANPASNAPKNIRAMNMEAKLKVVAISVAQIPQPRALNAR